MLGQHASVVEKHRAAEARVHLAVGLRIVPDDDVLDPLCCEERGDVLGVGLLVPAGETAEPQQAVAAQELPVGIIEQPLERARELLLRLVRSLPGLLHAVDHQAELLVRGKDHLGEVGVLGDEAGVDHRLLGIVEALDLAPDDPVDLVDAQVGEVRVEPGVHEQDVVDPHRRRPLPQPAAVDAIRPEGRHALDEPQRMGFFPRGAVEARPILLARLRQLLSHLEPLLPGRIASILRVLVDEGGGIGRRRVPPMSDQVHRLVVAEQNDHLAALLPGLLLQAHQQVQAGAHLGAAVEDVAGLHEDRVAARPAQLVVDEPDLPQYRREAVEGAVDVGDGHHATRVLSGRRRRDGADQENRQAKCGNGRRAAPVPTGADTGRWQVHESL